MLDLPRVIGHRGAAGSAPENTLASLRRAAQLGASWVEVDVQRLACGGLVLMHDLLLERTTDGRGEVARASLEHVARLDAGRWFGEAFAGEPVPTLEQALMLVLGLGLSINVEIKAPRGDALETGRAVARVIGALSPAERARVLVSGADPIAVAACRALVPDVPCALVLARMRGTWPSTVRELGCAAIVHAHRRLDAERAAFLRRHGGVPVLAYTVDDPVRAAQLQEWGVAGVFSDHPERLLSGSAAPFAA